MSSAPVIVTGLGYGDCGKGALVDYLTRSTGAQTVVRFNGGPQAGHNVVTAEGRHHTFAQFGSGTLAGANTLLSRFMLIEPYAILNEAEHLQQLGCEDVWSRVFIEDECLLITPVHQAANRLRELARGKAAHGTCGQGIGEAAADAMENGKYVLRARDMINSEVLALRLRDLAARKASELAQVIDFLRDHSAAKTDIETIENPKWIPVAVRACADVASAANIVRCFDPFIKEMIRQDGAIFEGAQGVLLDQDIGFHPYTTWSKTTSQNATQWLAEAGITTPAQKIGVLRCYSTRHGPGPFVTEDSSLRAILDEPHNSDLSRQGAFRAGVFDAVAATYAITHAKVDAIALTHLDRLPLLPPRICTEYRYHGSRFELQPPSDDLDARAEQSRRLFDCRPGFSEITDMSADGFVGLISEELGVPIRFRCFGPTAKHWYVSR